MRIHCFSFYIELSRCCVADRETDDQRTFSGSGTKELLQIRCRTILEGFLCLVMQIWRRNPHLAPPSSLLLSKTTPTPFHSPPFFPVCFIFYLFYLFLLLSFHIYLFFTLSFFTHTLFSSNTRSIFASFALYVCHSALHPRIFSLRSYLFLSSLILIIFSLSFLSFLYPPSFPYPYYHHLC